MKYVTQQMWLTYRAISGGRKPVRFIGKLACVLPCVSPRCQLLSFDPQPFQRLREIRADNTRIVKILKVVPSILGGRCVEQQVIVAVGVIRNHEETARLHLEQRRPSNGGGVLPFGKGREAEVSPTLLEVSPDVDTVDPKKEVNQIRWQRVPRETLLPFRYLSQRQRFADEMPISERADLTRLIRMFRDVSKGHRPPRFDIGTEFWTPYVYDPAFPHFRLSSYSFQQVIDGHSNETAG